MLSTIEYFGRAIFVLISVNLLLLTNFVYAASGLNKCPPSRFHVDSHEPKTYHTSNNLLRNEGEVQEPELPSVIIKGRVVDRQCRPVKNARIFMWQWDNSGKYPYEISNANSKVVKSKQKVFSTFKGCGIANTNQLGEFAFTTAYPKRDKNGIGVLNMKIERNNKIVMQTKINISDKFVAPKFSDQDLNYIHSNSVVYPNIDGLYQVQIVTKK